MPAMQAWSVILVHSERIFCLVVQTATKFSSRNSKAYARHPICTREPELATESEFLHEI